MIRLLLVGHGRMGRLVESLAPEYGFEIAGIVGPAESERPADWPAADVAIDFSIAAAVPATLRGLASHGMNAVIGTTGWEAFEQDARVLAKEAGIGVVAAPNFSAGVLVFTALAEYVAGLMQVQTPFGAWIHELHHEAKRDAPSGTARHLEAALRRGGYERPVDIASTRAGAIPGTHTIGFDSPGETITLTHTARDRTPFARGALDAARWVRGRAGWFGMRDVVGV